MRYIFYPLLLAYFFLLKEFDRRFSLNNARFTLQNIDPAPFDATAWNLPALSAEQMAHFETILSQPFYYLGKGAHCFAFVSQDDHYVLKFHAYPFHMRRYTWLTHPFKKTRTEYNTKRFIYNMNNYKRGYEVLQEETGCLWLQINPKNALLQKVLLIDRMKNRYRLPLRGYTFILQQRAKLIYPTLEQAVLDGKVDEAKAAITHILELFFKTCKKGYINRDALLTHNIGLLPDRAIHIDMGDLVPSPGIEKQSQTLCYVKEITSPLRDWLSTHSLLLLKHYDEEFTRFTNI